MEKPDTNQFFDQYMKEALRNQANEITPPSLLFDRIRAEINHKERENVSMKDKIKLRKMNPVLIIALILILSAATCFAASQITSLVSTSTDAFEEFPSAHQIEKAVNYVPDYVEKFSNGFYFQDASVQNTAAMDSDNNKVDETKGITFNYTRDQAQKEQLMTLSTDPEMQGITGELGPNEELITGQKLDLVYSKVTFKVVPEGYVPTEEENQKMDQGVMWISYGSDKIEISDIQYVRWVKDGISYNLMDKGYGLEKNEFIGMAQEVIRAAE